MENHDILRFLDSIDAAIMPHADPNETLDLFLLGRAALVLGFGVRLMTKDLDVVEVHGSRLLAIAVTEFGSEALAGSPNPFFLETVSSGLPPLPAGYQRRCRPVAGTWTVIRPMVPEVHDLIVTKLRRFHAGDREDIRILCDTGEVLSATLRERLESAHSFSDRDDPRVVTAFRNLATVVDYLEGTRHSL